MDHQGQDAQLSKYFPLLSLAGRIFVTAGKLCLLDVAELLRVEVVPVTDSISTRLVLDAQVVSL